MPIHPRRAAEALSDWTPLQAFLIEAKLAPDDLVRMLELGVAPRMQTVNETIWVHRPTLPDWRELLKLYGFKTQREALVEATRSEAAHAV
jgi:hypothetical protein